MMTSGFFVMVLEQMMNAQRSGRQVKDGSFFIDHFCLFRNCSITPFSNALRRAWSYRGRLSSAPTSDGNIFTTMAENRDPVDKARAICW